jgi:thioredoxin-related protein
MIWCKYFSYRWFSVLSMLFFLPLPILFAQTNEELESLRWYQWTEGVVATQASGKYMLVDVYTDWCGWCKKMDRTVYGHPRVQQLLAANFIPIKLNAESTNLITNGTNQYTEQEWAKMLGVTSYPTILVYNKQFQLVSRFSGYKEPERFIRYLKYICEKYYTQYSFQEYLKSVHDDQ